MRCVAGNVFIVAVQNDRYLILTAQLYDAKDMAATAKTKGDKADQRMAQDRIRIIQQGSHVANFYTFFFYTFSMLFVGINRKKYIFLFLEMKLLESHPVFNPAIKVSDAPEREKKVFPVSEDKEELDFNLFEQAEKEAPTEKGSVGPGDIHFSSNFNKSCSLFQDAVP